MTTQPITGYTYEQASRELAVSLSTIKRAVSAGVLSSIRYPKVKAKYIPVEQVEQFRGKPLLHGVRRIERKQQTIEEVIRSATENVPATLNLDPQTVGKALGQSLATEIADSVVDNLPQRIYDALQKKKSLLI